MMTKEDIEQLVGQVVWTLDKNDSVPVPLRVLPTGEWSRKFTGVPLGSLTTNPWGEPEKTGWKSLSDIYRTEAEAWIALLRRARVRRAEAEQTIEREALAQKEARANLRRLRKEGEPTEREVVMAWLGR